MEPENLSAPRTDLALWVTGLGFLIMTTDGYDLQSAALVAPTLRAEWQLRPELLGPVLAASIWGMAVGSIILGWLGDRAGRKTALLTCMALLSAGSFASSHASSLPALWLFRFTTGLGLGGATPIATTLVAEWAAPKWRTIAVAVVIVGVPLGGVIGTVAAGHIIPTYGWRAVFLLGAVLPLVFLVIALPLLPESPVFRARERVHQQHTGSELLALVTTPYLPATLAIWGSFILNSLTLYGFVNWLPLVLSTAGLPLPPLSGSLLFNLGGVVGSVCGSILITRFGSRPIGSSIALAGAAAAVLVGVGLMGGNAGEASLRVLAPLILAGFCLNGMQNFLYAVAAHSYPMQIRAYGVGSASAVARVGGVLSSFVGSTYFSFSLPVASFFYILAVFIAATAACFFSVPTHIPGTRPRVSGREAENYIG
jgi:AAHS family 4-hydroxybenzoate transporter-like MFS transporter